MAKIDIALKKVITPEFRVSFPQVFEPKGFKGQEPKYSIVMLFDKKSTDMRELESAARHAAREKWGEDKNEWPKRLKWPFRDGEERSDTDGYKGCTFITATSISPPGVVDENLDPFMDKKGFYSGCYARAELIAFAYDTNGNMGVSFSLQNVQKLRDGKSFSGKKAAADVFTKVAKESDNPGNYMKDDNGDDDDDDDDDGEQFDLGD